MIFGKEACGRHHPGAGDAVVSEHSAPGPPSGPPVSSVGDRSLSWAQPRRPSMGQTQAATSRTFPGGCRPLSPLPITLHVVPRRNPEAVSADHIPSQTPLRVSPHTRLCGKKWYLSFLENIENQCIEQTHFRLLPSEGVIWSLEDATDFTWQKNSGRDPLLRKGHQKAGGRSSQRHCNQGGRLA